MPAKIKTPYGTFNSIAIAARTIAHTHGPDFIKKYPNYDFPYNPTTNDRYPDHVGPGHNNSVIHYIYHAVHDMIGSVDGRKAPIAGWSRL